MNTPNTLRNKIFDVVNPRSRTRGAELYNHAMIFFIVLSLVPLAFKDDVALFGVTDVVVTVVFVADYAMRWVTADKLLGEGGTSFFRYPFTPMAVLDLISILPSFFPVNDSFRLLRLLRFVRALRFVRYLRRSKSLRMFELVLKRQRVPLLAFGSIALCYIVVCALVVFNVEPQTFPTFFDAVYWACISLSTVGYGDIYPVTVIGKTVSIASALVGIAVVAFPASILTSGYMQVAEEVRHIRQTRFRVEEAAARTHPAGQREQGEAPAGDADEPAELP